MAHGVDGVLMRFAKTDEPALSALIHLNCRVRSSTHHPHPTTGTDARHRSRAAWVVARKLATKSAGSGCWRGQGDPGAATNVAVALGPTAPSINTVYWTPGSRGSGPWVVVHPCGSIPYSTGSPRTRWVPAVCQTVCWSVDRTTWTPFAVAGCQPVRLLAIISKRKRGVACPSTTTCASTSPQEQIASAHKKKSG